MVYDIVLVGLPSATMAHAHPCHHWRYLSYCVPSDGLHSHHLHRVRRTAQAAPCTRPVRPVLTLALRVTREQGLRSRCVASDNASAARSLYSAMSARVRPVTPCTQSFSVGAMGVRSLSLVDIAAMGDGGSMGTMLGCRKRALAVPPRCKQAQHIHSPGHNSAAPRTTLYTVRCLAQAGSRQASPELCTLRVDRTGPPNATACHLAVPAHITPHTSLERRRTGHASQQTSTHIVLGTRISAHLHKLAEHAGCVTVRFACQVVQDCFVVLQVRRTRKMTCYTVIECHNIAVVQQP